MAAILGEHPSKRTADKCARLYWPATLVQHDFHPIPGVQNLYEITVSITNPGLFDRDLRYRRVMDWDVEPTAFDEFVTIDANAPLPVFVILSNNGFDSPDPLSPPDPLGGPFTRFGLFTDVGIGAGDELDHGAMFDFRFGLLGSGQTRTFDLYYGAASSEAVALGALGAVGADIWSLGQPDTVDGPGLGQPNTFIFGFKDGGAPQGPQGASSSNAEAPEPVPAWTPDPDAQPSRNRNQLGGGGG